MAEKVQVHCAFTGELVKVKILSVIKSQNLQISINSPNQEALRCDKYTRGFVIKKRPEYCNWKPCKPRHL
jgi:hypothetical protein